jgi:hypothetical protein
MVFDDKSVRLYLDLTLAYLERLTMATKMEMRLAMIYLLADEMDLMATNSNVAWVECCLSKTIGNFYSEIKHRLRSFVVFQHWQFLY